MTEEPKSSSSGAGWFWLVLIGAFVLYAQSKPPGPNRQSPQWSPIFWRQKQIERERLQNVVPKFTAPSTGLPTHARIPASGAGSATKVPNERAQ